ncbi:hypothetical protein [Sandaracinus amylolyticus]|uniref:hypothetical protein n=2 Tax=Sandaracinus TaxID=1055688 RepID=UPI001F357031|nr:hypothetical protein [Sandaracinus amylolyticus]
MEDVLELYARKHDEREPVVCLDERPVPLRDAARDGTAMSPGKIARVDYEYVRRGTANIFCIIEALTGRRHARSRRPIVRESAEADRAPLQTRSHDSSGRRQPEQGRALWRRFMVHFTPKHASWLNAAEMEVSLVVRECLGRRRIGDLATLRHEVSAWNRRADRARDVRRVSMRAVASTPTVTCSTRAPRDDRERRDVRSALSRRVHGDEPSSKRGSPASRLRRFDVREDVPHERHRASHGCGRARGPWSVDRPHPRGVILHAACVEGARRSRRC